MLVVADTHGYNTRRQYACKLTIAYKHYTSTRAPKQRRYIRSHMYAYRSMGPAKKQPFTQARKADTHSANQADTEMHGPTSRLDYSTQDGALNDDAQSTQRMNVFIAFTA
eukprot:Blabericola_migrator_1__6327@NODE_3194_length_1956_cov_17_492853_g1998_i0_p2_GENE_NODE_3194_length_1956_cov_17_492853_g1998_i0NODE_3194_length_1956_cov_17_492853_g1998_i0_p2_ORF_typecomplete_len110_score2_52IGR/PF09597_10/0_27IGR/PF09597_10/1_4e04_NODE_3194_length_1956_cov_17_492853_g1998_i08061135